jgi:hypothetical protein
MGQRKGIRGPEKQSKSMDMILDIAVDVCRRERRLRGYDSSQELASIAHPNPKQGRLPYHMAHDVGDLATRFPVDAQALH